MLDDFTVYQALPFTAALLVMILLASINILTTLAGLEVFDFLDSLLPDLDGDLDLGDAISPDSLSPSFLEGMLLWLNLGRVPLIVTLNIFLFCFSALGFLMLGMAGSIGVSDVPWLITIPIALVGSILPVKIGNGLAARIWPKDETEAVSSETFIGRVAKITIGVATHKRAAEAKLKGPLGRSHYVMVYADNETDSFPQGSAVLLVGRRDSKFTAIAVENDHLSA
ncbi:MAG: hypothetical protein SynsKO_15550 [Synoicihabitans sp.]